MNTTNFYVELIVVGLGPFLALALVAAAVFGCDMDSLLAMASWSNFIILLPIIYLLGIITDRCADALFEALWKEQLKEKEYFASSEDKRSARRMILAEAGKIAELMEYGRSRMRICRGWAFTAPLLMVSVVIASSSCDLSLKEILFLEAGLAFLAVSSWFCWRSLARADYRKVKESSEAFKQWGHS